MILKGDCIKVMKAMKPNSVDAIVCDPPYNLHFMGKDWDKDLLHERWLTEAYQVLKPGGSMLVMGGTRTSHRLACAIEDSGFIIKDTLMWIYGSGFPKAQDITPHIDAKMLGITTKQVKEKRKRIGVDENFLKRNPKDNSDGIYESGLKDGINGAIRTKPLTPEAKHWNGFKVGGIKPAYEPIIWAVKPPEGSYIDNVLKWGVGAVNVDECRIGVESTQINRKNKSAELGYHGKGNQPNITGSIKGRFPANVILSHHPDCVQVGMKRVKCPSGGIGNSTAKSMFSGGNHPNCGNWYADSDGCETVESWDCHPDCAVRLLNEQSGNLSSGKPAGIKAGGKLNCYGVFAGGIPVTGIGDSGGASRFFYCAKASRGERNVGLEGMEEKEAFNYGHKENPGRVAPKKSYPRTNNHPTVKPIKLFEWLIKLVTREDQIVLDPFIGSGTTIISAHNAGRKCIGIEKEEEYIEIARRRITHWQSQPKQMEMRV